ncbi:MAG: dienelactone hydrolase family protein [Anaerolineae bacterium]|nr:dienelactone hydrolase family protein [Anaerolineae bacterium]MDQ7036809.1 dienelactone hydrolase family protein [Anaerolineae bacterium]
MKAKFALLIIVFLSLTTLVLAEDNPTNDLRPDAPELAARGMYDIGVRTLELVNPDQIDIVSYTPDAETPRYDRPITVEVWYPAVIPEGVEQVDLYQSTLGRPAIDPSRPLIPFTWTGAALRDAEPDNSNAPYPLLIVSHGWPGNRYLMSHLAENLASKGYVVVSIDHLDSRYDDPTLPAFQSTLLNRRLDILFVLNEMAAMSTADDGFLAGLLDADNTGLIGYSMGGYGALNTTGAGVSEAAMGFFGQITGGSDALSVNQAGSETYADWRDERIKAVMAFAPWGMNFGIWDVEALAAVDVPYFLVAGSQDEVAGYEIGTRAIFENLVNSDRYLLTLMGAGHNSGAPNPAPVEAADNAAEFSHFADSVWDTTRQNNIAEHFATAFFGIQLKDEDLGAYLDLVEVATDGVYAVDDDGNFTEENTYWMGFAPETARGLTLQHQTP